MGNGYKEPEWEEVIAWQSAKVADCLERLKTPRLDLPDTQFYRGALWILEELEQLNEAKPAPVVEAGPGYWPDPLE